MKINVPTGVMCLKDWCHVSLGHSLNLSLTAGNLSTCFSKNPQSEVEIEAVIKVLSLCGCH
jgi:hypothetical protein